MDLKSWAVRLQKIKFEDSPDGGSESESREDELKARCDELRLLHMHMGASVAEDMEYAIAAGSRPVPGPLAVELVARAQLAGG